MIPGRKPAGCQQAAAERVPRRRTNGVGKGKEALLSVPSHPARELDKDLAAAGIPKRTEAGKVNFHACQVAYTTFVIEVSATVKEAQTPIRHSTARTRDPRLAEVAARVGAMILPSDRGPSNGVAGFPTRKMANAGQAASLMPS